MSKRRVRLLALLLSGLVLAGCSSSAATTASPPSERPAPAAVASSAPTPMVRATLVPLVKRPPAGNRRHVLRHDPLTGLELHHSPVVVIKVDNARSARPYQRGLGAAAVVYEELVESGQTRFAAVYDDSTSTEVGPIRSLRETDISLLGAYGRVTVGFSGANHGVLRTFQRAVRAGRLRDGSVDALPGSYREGARRSDARNFFSSPARIARARPGARATFVGFRFGRLSTRAGRRVTIARVSFSETESLTVRYNRRTGRWAVFQDGRQLNGVAPTNVIIQTVRVQGSRYVDVLGARTPYTATVGRGALTLLRDGRLVRGGWRRLTMRTGTRFLDDKGRDLPLKPGSTWILLQPQGRPTAFS